MPDAAAIRRIAALTLLILAVRVVSAAVVSGPGYTDAYYYTAVAGRLARGEGLTADFIWSPLEAGSLVLPVASHLFWVPLSTVLGAIGIALAGPLVGDFRAAQAAIIVVAALLPATGYAAARRLGAGEPLALAAAAAGGLGGLFAPGLVDLDAYAPAAVIGTLFFLAYGRAAAGDVRAGALAGLLVGLLYLARSEGALFGVALLALLVSRRTRVAGAAGAAAAIAIGGGWLARDVAAGAPPDLFARAVLLVRYDQFFAVASPTLAELAASLDRVLAARAGALAANATTFAFTFALLPLVPLAAGLRALWARAEVRAWAGLAVLVYLTQSLVWTLHSTRGSYFHSLAAFFPFGLAIAAVGARELLAARSPRVLRAWAWGAVALVGAITFASVAQWDAVFNGAARVRAAAVDAIPPGPFLAIDGAAWRWISGRPAVVTPSDGLDAAFCYASAVGARSVVLEEARFAAYDDLYAGVTRPGWLGEPIVRGTVKIFPVTLAPNSVCTPR